MLANSIQILIYSLDLHAFSNFDGFFSDLFLHIMIEKVSFIIKDELISIKFKPTLCIPVVIKVNYSFSLSLAFLLG